MHFLSIKNKNSSIYDNILLKSKLNHIPIYFYYSF